MVPSLGGKRATLQVYFQYIVVVRYHDAINSVVDSCSCNESGYLATFCPYIYLTSNIVTVP